MNKINILIAFLLVFNYSNAQFDSKVLHYNQLIYKADFLTAKKDFIKANSYYLKALKIHRSTDINYKLSKNYLVSNDVKKGKQYLTEALKQGMDTLDLVNDSLFVNKIGLNEIRKLYADYHSLSLEHKNLELVSTIQYLIKSDQNFRRIRRNFMKDSLKRDFYFEILGKMDSLNKIEIDKIITNHGIPTEDEVGMDGETYFFVLLLHISLNEKNELNSLYAEKVKNAVQKKYYPAFRYAVLFDYQQRNIDGTQNFGSYGTPSGEYLDINNIETVDKRRLEIGLNTLSEDAVIKGYKLPKLYKIE